MTRVLLIPILAVVALFAVSPPVAAEEGKELTGLLRNATGQPVAEADVVFTQDENDEAWPNNPPKYRPKSNVSVKTAADGRFSVQLAKPSEPYAIGIVHDLGYADLNEATFPADGVVTLLPWGRIEGTVYLAGKPAPNVPIRVWNFRSFGRPLVTFDYTVRSDNEGKFVVKRALPDYVMVMHEGNQTARVARYAEVEANKTTRVELGGGNGRPVVGRVSPGAGGELKVGKDIFQMSGFVRKIPDPPEFPLPRTPGQEYDYAARFVAEALWRKTDEGKAYYRDYLSFGVRVEPDGTFRIDDVPPGEFVLTVSLQPIAADRTIGNPILKLTRTVTVNAGAADEPVDLGTLEPDQVESGGL